MRELTALLYLNVERRLVLDFLLSVVPTPSVANGDAPPLRLQTNDPLLTQPHQALAVLQPHLPDERQSRLST